MEKQEIRTFGRRHGKKLSPRKTALINELLPVLMPEPGYSGRRILEIGFGAGEHVRSLATANPNAEIIGAEPFVNGVAALLSAITNPETNAIMSPYQNIRIFPDDVRILLRDPAYRFDEIWVLHPDPWPKAKHEKRRLLQAEFISLLGQHLRDGGRIIIGTDHWGYYDWIIDQVKNTSMRMISGEIDVIHTRYQNKNMAATDTPKYLVLGH